MVEAADLADLALEQRPAREALIAAEVRQLVRSRDAGDRVAMWLAAGTLGIALRGFLKDLLSGEPDWDSRGHWIDGLSHRAVGLEPHRPALRRVRSDDLGP